jgi:asparagine synthase (glutamine-hydrolysing)
LAREQGIQTLLGGDGGDEIFGGNERYVGNLVFKKYADLPAWFRRGLFEPLLRLTPARGPFYKARRYVRRANLPNPRRFYSYNLLAETDNATIFQPDFLQQVDTDCFFQRAQQVYDQASPAAETDRLLYLDMKFTITDNDLRKVTQMVEAAGLQVRYPLLDRDLVDFAGTIPPDLKVKPGKNRYIFKQAMRGFLPDGIIHKTKHGMGLPIASWLREDKELNRLLEDTLFSPSARVLNYVRPEYLEQLKSHFYTDTTTTFYGDNLWVFLVLELWLREHL